MANRRSAPESIKDAAERTGMTLSEMGARAHRILDWIRHNGTIYCETPRMGWHVATPRERKKLTGSRYG